MSQGAIGQHTEQQSRNLGSCWDIKSTGQVQVSRYTARYMCSYAIGNTSARIQGREPVPSTALSRKTVIQDHTTASLFIYDLIVPSPTFSKSLPSVNVLNRSRSSCILNIFSTLNHHVPSYFHRFL